MTTVTITIAAPDAAEAMLQVRSLAGAGLPAAYTGPVCSDSKPVEGSSKDAPAPVEAEKPKRTRKAKAETVEEAPEAVEAEETEAEETEFTRADLTQTIKDLHAAKGDAILPKVQAILKQFGAAKQSEVKDEDIGAVVPKLKALV